MSAERYFELVATNGEALEARRVAAREARAGEAEARALRAQVQLAMRTEKLAELEASELRARHADADKVVAELVAAGKLPDDLLVHMDLRNQLVTDPSIIRLALLGLPRRVTQRFPRHLGTKKGN